MVNFEYGRQRPTNYIQICKNIADQYPFGTPHGVQKDGIQNSMDARKGRGAVEVSFDLVQNKKGRFLTITDANTTGLTGPILNPQEYDVNLPVNAHWARFESFAFTKDDPDAIGARGQGKFIFLDTSKNYTMFYDTLRDDGVYRVGATKALPVGCPILPAPNDEPWEDTHAAKILKSECGLDPLATVGSRVIIVDPNDESVEELKNGRFLRAIEETWFRAIEKKNLKVMVCGTRVGLPDPYPLPKKDGNKHKVWILGKDFDEQDIRLSTGEKYKLKRFHAVYLHNQTLPEDMQGIAIIHQGMKITSLPANLFPPKVRERITGFIEFDRVLDSELRKGEHQHPSHYDLKWRKRIPQAIKQYVTFQLNTFGKEKLNLGTDVREIRKRRRDSAEEFAIRQLLKHAEGLDLFGSKGIKHPRPEPPEPPPVKPLAVSIHNFSFPDPNIAPRVNWGQKFSELKVGVYNRTKKDCEVVVSVSILQGDAIVKRFIEHESITITRGESSLFDPFDIRVNEEGFEEPGKYRLKALLLDGITGDKIDAVSRQFWVEKDPPLRQPFNIVRVPRFDGDLDKMRQWRTSGSINLSPTVLINTGHPAYRDAEDDEDRLGDYMFGVVLEAAMQFVLDRESDEGPDFHPLNAQVILGGRPPVDREEVPSRAYNEAFKYLSEVRWRAFQEA